MSVSPPHHSEAVRGSQPRRSRNCDGQLLCAMGDYVKYKTEIDRKIEKYIDR